MAQIKQQSTIMIAKPHMYVWMNRMSVKDDRRKCGGKVNDIILISLNQLQEWQAQLPENKEDMSHD